MATLTHLSITHGRCMHCQYPIYLWSGEAEWLADPGTAHHYMNVCPSHAGGHEPMPADSPSPALTEAFTDEHGRVALRYLADDADAGIAAGSEVLVTDADAFRLTRSQEQGHMWPASHYDSPAVANLSAALGYAYRSTHARTPAAAAYNASMAAAYAAMSSVARNVRTEGV